MKILYVTDLDGTLIAEHKDKACENILAIETAHGKSYITKENLNLLKEIGSRADIMPLTTRSQGSFARFDIGMDFKYALIENGGCMLHNGEVDKEWQEESMALLLAGREKEMVCRKYLESHGYKVKSNSTFVIDYINKEMAMEETQKCYEELEALTGDELEITIHAAGQIFAVHKSLRKGESLERFLKKHPYDIVITCGDGKADFGMLRAHESVGLTGSPAKFQFPKEEHRENNHKFTNYALKKVLSLITTKPRPEFVFDTTGSMAV